MYAIICVTPLHPLPAARTKQDVDPRDCKRRRQIAATLTFSSGASRRSAHMAFTWREKAAPSRSSNSAKLNSINFIEYILFLAGNRLNTFALANDSP